MQTPPSDFDSPWKEILESYFLEFMAFFFPEADRDIDWSRGYEFLDKELRKVARRAESGTRYVDKLVKVWRFGGEESWVLVHIEVQGQPESAFAERMYIYNNRIYDRYGRKVVSVAILADSSESWRPERFEYSLWGCEVSLRFPSVKLLDYRRQLESLKGAENAFSVVVSAHLRALESRADAELRLVWKLELVKGLYRAGYDRQRILDLFRFIDWVMTLPEQLDDDFWKDVSEYEERRNMRYITSVERRGIERGIQQGLQQGIERGLQQGIQQGMQQGLQQGMRNAIVDLLEFRFGTISDACRTQLAEIASIESLQALHHATIRVESIEEFQGLLNRLP